MVGCIRGPPGSADGGVRLSSDPEQVSGLTIAAGSITAQVHGSGREPYEVWIDLPVFSRAEWARAEQAIAAHTDCYERILDGDLPAELDNLFTRCGLSLLPAVQDLTMDCSCPGWAMPCEHLAAALHMLARAFDTDPFDVLTWRGRTRPRLLQHLHALRTSIPAELEPVPEPATAEAERPLTECLDDFWVDGPVAGGRPDEHRHRPADHALNLIGPPDLVIRGRDLAALLRPAYQAFRAR